MRSRVLDIIEASAGDPRAITDALDQSDRTEKLDLTIDLRETVVIQEKTTTLSS